MLFLLPLRILSRVKLAKDSLGRIRLPTVSTWTFFLGTVPFHLPKKQIAVAS